MKTKGFLSVLVVVCWMAGAGPAWSWYDKTHVAIARAAGYEYWFNAAGADLVKDKLGELRDREGNNHYFDNLQGKTVDSAMVLDQTRFYDQLPADKKNKNEGHLYGAIVAAVREHDKWFREGRDFLGYHLAFAAHYIGDLSMPNHNIPWMKDGYPANDAEAGKWHRENDGVVEKLVLGHPEKIRKQMYFILLRDGHLEEDLASEIARIANLSRSFGERLRAERRVMTPEEAFVRLGHSASLLQAMLDYYRRNR
ncbi:MAG: hypothetical protein M0009_04640 [Deltaproteobacteria bacterium]|nr:hypothetical protein [Deltaproteobacteria bacterium]